MAVVSLVAGANCAVPMESLTLEIELKPEPMAGVEVDLSAFLLTSAGKVRGDADMVFYGQPESANGGVALISRAAGRATFRIDLPLLEAAVEKIALTATLYENHQSFAAWEQLRVTVANPMGEPLLELPLPLAERSESALILGEFYRRQSQWKFRAVGQGFIGGLKALAEHFGVEVADPPAPAVEAAPPPPEPAPPPPAPKPVSLSKITLDKSRPTVSLEKRAAGFGEIKVNLNWNLHATSLKSPSLIGRLMGRSDTPRIDLDLGCLYELQEGTIGAVQALGSVFGAFDTPPFIHLLGDDRTGRSPDGEWLRINGQHWSQMKRILIYCYIYSGVPNWAETDGVVTIFVPNEPPLEIRLSESSDTMGMCAIVLLENIAGALKVKREVRYFSGHRELDAAYHWGLNWRIGSK